jgi:phosphoribosyl 1,2-cyclic phosphate phosphodiesterase
MKAGDHFTTAAGDEVWAMRADHVRGATVLRIRRNGKVLFYGHDSGLYPAEALDQLSDGIVLDVALLDCTNGSLDVGDRGHMGVNGVAKMVRELRSRGAIVDRTRVIATHFSHNGGYLHEDLVRAFLPHGIEVAFDGMVIAV